MPTAVVQIRRVHTYARALVFTVVVALLLLAFTGCAPASANSQPTAAGVTAEVVVRTSCGAIVNSTTITVARSGSWRNAFVEALRDNADELQAQACTQEAVEMRALADRIESHQ